MSGLLRIAYRGLLRFYPASFRSEFGEEMLWIFDEEIKRGRMRAAPLLNDAARSIAARRMKPPSERFAAKGYYVEIESALPAQRVAQALLAILYFGIAAAVATVPAVLMILKLIGTAHR